MLRKEQPAERDSVLCKDDESDRRGFSLEALVQIYYLPFLNMVFVAFSLATGFEECQGLGGAWNLAGANGRERCGAAGTSKIPSS